MSFCWLWLCSSRAGCWSSAVMGPAGDASARGGFGLSLWIVSAEVQSPSYPRCFCGIVEPEYQLVFPGADLGSGFAGASDYFQRKEYLNKQMLISGVGSQTNTPADYEPMETRQKVTTFPMTGNNEDRHQEILAQKSAGVNQHRNHLLLNKI